MEHEQLASPYIAILPLIVVGVLNKVFTQLIGAYYGETYELQLAAMAKPITVSVDKVAAVWAVQGALLAGILTVFIFAFPRVSAKFAERQQGGRGWCPAGIDEHGIRVWLRCRDRRAPRFHCHSRSAACHSKPACKRSHHGDGAGGHHRIGVRGNVDRPCGHVGPVHRCGKRCKYSARGAASRARPGIRRHGHPASQWRRDHAALSLRPHSPAILQGYLCSYLHKNGRSLRSHRRSII